MINQVQNQVFAPIFVFGAGGGGTPDVETPVIDNALVNNTAPAFDFRFTIEFSDTFLPFDTISVQYRTINSGIPGAWADIATGADAGTTPLFVDHEPDPFDDLQVRIRTDRSGLHSAWTAPHGVTYPTPATFFRITESGDRRITEDGQPRRIE